MDLKTTHIDPRQYSSPPFSLEVPNSPSIPGETIPRRHPGDVNGLVSRPSPEIATLYDVLLHSAKHNKDLPTAGTRKLIETHVESKMVKEIIEGKEIEVEKKWTFFEMGKFEYITFGEYAKKAMNLGSGLRKLGLEPGDRLHIFATTSAHWLLMSHAAVTQSMPIVTSYATLGPVGLTTSLSQTNAEAIFVDAALLPNLLGPLGKPNSLRYIITNDETKVSVSDMQEIKNSHDHITILSLQDLESLGEMNPVEPVPPGKDDLCCIMYTSGSTGTPKGVPLKHKNVVAAIAGINSVFGRYQSTADSMLAYLPLAHSFEYAFENCCFYWGTRIGYGSPRTLSSLSMKNCEGDIKTFAPSILVGVPAVWETLRKGIENKVSKEGFLKRTAFWGGLRAKELLCGYNLPGVGVIDKLVFDTVKVETGGNLRACVNGAGPVGKETRRFISTVLNPLFMGYGLTETSAMGILMDPFQWTDDSLGAPAGGVEIKLIDFPDAGYFAANSPPQGEILIRGEGVMSGYYANEAETKDTLTKDGWLKTGDIGEWTPSGHLKIIDRKKNLVKTLNGEYIALEKLESLYRSSNLITNICVYAAADKSRPVAVIVPSPTTLGKLAVEHNITDTAPISLVNNSLIKAAFLKNLQVTGRKCGLVSFEILEGLVVTEKEWTPQNGLLTVAQKLNRREIVKMYHTELEGAYTQNGKAS